MSPEEYVEAVLTVVEQIPPGRVMSYGAIAEYLYESSGRDSARLVGTIMARHGGGVPWHRVVNAAGRLPPGHESRARKLLVAEGVRFKADKVLMAEATWWPEDTRYRPEAGKQAAGKQPASPPRRTRTTRAGEQAAGKQPASPPPRTRTTRKSTA